MVYKVCYKDISNKNTVSVRDILNEVYNELYAKNLTVNGNVSIIAEIFKSNEYFIQSIPYSKEVWSFIFGTLSNTSKPVIADPENDSLEVIELNGKKSNLMFTPAIFHNDYLIMKVTRSIKVEKIMTILKEYYNKIFGKSIIDFSEENYQLIPTTDSFKIFLNEINSGEKHKYQFRTLNCKINESDEGDFISKQLKKVFNGKLNLENINLKIDVKVSSLKKERKKKKKKHTIKNCQNSLELLFEDVIQNLADIEVDFENDAREHKIFNIKEDKFVTDKITFDEPSIGEFVSMDFFQQASKRLLEVIKENEQCET